MAKKPVEYIIVENFNPDEKAMQKALGFIMQRTVKWWKPAATRRKPIWRQGDWSRKGDKQMNEDLQRILKPRTLAADWSRNCWNQADEVLNQQSPGQSGPDNLIRDLSFYHDLRESVSKGFDSAYKPGAFTVLTSVILPHRRRRQRV